MNRYFLAISVILLSSLSSLLFGGSSVGAASEFDNLVRTTQNLVVRNAYGDDIDMSMKWRTETAELLELRCSQSHQDQCDLLESFNANVGGLNDSHWGVRTMDSGNSIIGGFKVFWTENSTSDQCNFLSAPDVRLECTGSTFRAVNVYGYNYNSPGNMSTNGFYINESAAPSMNTITAYGSWYSPQESLFIWYFNVNYPDGYAGPTIPETWDQPEQLYPDYQWSINNGLLGITYMKNLPHFLTGTSYIVVNHMSENWEELGDEVMNDSVIPAGDLVWQGDIVLEPGYYMVRISYDQVFHSPPWPENGNFRVENRWIQIYWDGTNSAQGTTVGCGTDICNDWQDEQSWAEKTLSYLNIPLYGLQAAIIAPLNFIAELPGKQCTPLQLPLPHMGNMQLPCMRSIYEEHFGLILNLYQTVIVGLFSYYLAINAISTIKGISSPKDDRIEVVKL